MKRLFIVALASFMAFCIVACGENANKRQEERKNEAVMEQNKANEEAVKKTDEATPVAPTTTGTETE